MHATVRDAMTTNAVAGKDTPFKDMAAMPHGYRARAFPLLDERGMVIRVASEVGLPAKEALNGTVPGASSRCEHGSATAARARDLARCSKGGLHVPVPDAFR